MKRTRTLIYPLLLVLYEIATYLSNDAYLPALPTIIHDLSSSQRLVQLTITAWFLGSTSIQLILGPVSDRYGRRPVLLMGGLAFVIATMICATTSNIYLLLAARVFQGATISSMMIAGYATIHELFETKEAIIVLAWMSSVIILAPAFGPLLGAIIIHYSHWRIIFYMLAIWGAISITALYFIMPETKQKKDRHPIKLKLIINQYWRIIKNPQYMRLTLSYRLLYAAIIAWISASPLLIINTFHKSVIQFGFFQVLIFGCFIFGTRLIKPLINYYSALSLSKVGMSTSFFGGILSIVFALIFPQALWGMITSMLFIGAGSGISFAILNRLAIEASTEPMGPKVTIGVFIMGICGTLGSLLVSGFYSGDLISLAIILFAFSLLSFFCLIKGVSALEDSKNW